MYPTVLLFLARDDRDAVMVEGFLGIAPRIGVERIVVGHCQVDEPLPPMIARNLPTSKESALPDLQPHLDRIRAALPDAVVEELYEQCTPLELLEAAERDISPDLVVIARDPCTDDRPAWGQIGHNIIRHSDVSVLVVPSDWTGPTNGAVVGMDFSEHAIEALQVARRLFDDTVCVYQFNPAHRHAGSMTESEFATHVADNAQDTFAEVVVPLLKGSAPPLEVVAADKASDAVVDRAGRDHYIVAGSRGLSPFAAMLLGSTAERIAGRARAPVLVIRKKGEMMGVVEGLIHR